MPLRINGLLTQPGQCCWILFTAKSITSNASSVPGPVCVNHIDGPTSQKIKKQSGNFGLEIFLYCHRVPFIGLKNIFIKNSHSTNKSELLRADMLTDMLIIHTIKP